MYLQAEDYVYSSAADYAGEKGLLSLSKTTRCNRAGARVNQVLMAISLASISGISRIFKIAAFSGDGLERTLRRHKTGRRKIWRATQECMGEVHSISSKYINQEVFYA